MQDAYDLFGIGSLGAGPSEEDLSKLDTNKDGKISGEEIVEHFFSKIDSNSDGIITEEEFVVACIVYEEINQLLGFPSTS